jgi:hypothetical protein
LKHKYIVRRYKRVSPYIRSNNVYNICIRATPIQWSTGGGYTQQNLNIQATDVLTDIATFKVLVNEFQYVKVRSVVIEFQPDQVEGTRPPTGYLIMVGNNFQNVDYSQLPTLPGARFISNIRKTRYRFTRPGRNPDFNKWEDCLSQQGTAYLNDSHFEFRIRFNDTPRLAPMIINVSYYLSFSKRNIPMEENKQLAQFFDSIGPKKQITIEAGENPDLMKKLFSE